MWTQQSDISETVRGDQVMVLAVIVTHLKLEVERTKREGEREVILKIQ